MYNEKYLEERCIPDKYKEVIKDVYLQLDTLLQRPEMYSSYSDEILERCHALEYVLQFLWGFDTTKKMHCYDYRIKGCTCPKLDNDDRVGTDQRVIRYGCPVHGGGRYEPEESEAVEEVVSDDGTGC